MQDLIDPRDAQPLPPSQLGHVLPRESQLEPLGVPLYRFGAIVRRHYLIVLVTFLLGVGGTALIVSRTPKEYTARVSILIEPQRTQVSDLQAISPDFRDVTSLIRTQIDILRSPALARNVVTTLDLEGNPEFVHGDGGLVGALSAAVHRILDGISAQRPPAARPSRVAMAAAALSGKIGFSNELRSSVLDVLVTTRDPALSARIANELARQYLDFKRREKFAAMQRAGDWLESQLAGLSKQVRSEEVAVQVYRGAHGLTDLSWRGPNGRSTPTSITGQQLTEAAAQLGEASRTLAAKEAELAQARVALREHRTDALPEVLRSPAIAQLAERQAVADGEEASMAASRGPNYPGLIARRAQTAALRSAVQQEMTKIVASLRTEANAARTQEQSLRARMTRLVAAVGAENAAEVGLRALEDRARATRTIYESFLTRAAELANVAGIQEPDATLVSSATAPLGPSAPKSTRLVVVAAVLSAVLGIGLACAVEASRRGFSVPDQLEACVGFPVIALVPRRPARRHSARRRNEFAASVNGLRARLGVLGHDRPQVVVVSSAMPREGKSALATAIAMNAAAAGWKALLVEGDFHRPSLAARFKIPPGPGLHEALASGSPLGPDHVAVAVRPGLDVLPAGSGDGDPQELLASARMAEVIRNARTRYQVIVIDTPPLLPVPDALALVPQADATILVVRWERTPRTAVQDAVRLLRDSRVGPIGAVLTQVDLRVTARLGGRPPGLYNYYRPRSGTPHARRAS